MKRIIVLLILSLLVGVPATAQTEPVEIVNVDGFENSCTRDNNVAGFTIRFNVAGEVTVTGQAYTEYYNDTTIIGPTAGGGQLVQFTVNAPFLPENSVVQYTISNGDPDTAVTASINCTTGEVFLEPLLGEDGRLLAGNDLLVVIYPRLNHDLEPILDFYTVNPEDNSRGTLTLRVDADTLADLPDRPDDPIEIASTRGGIATLYKLPTGEFQVNYAPTDEGKFPVVIFDAVSPTDVRRADY